MRFKVKLETRFGFGHETRSGLLIDALLLRGHQMVTRNPDVLILDYPEEHMPRDHCDVRVVMGCPPVSMLDWAWYPLGDPDHIHAKRMLLGAQYIMLDPALKQLAGNTWDLSSFLVTFGGVDGAGHTEIAMDVLSDYRLDIVKGPRCARRIRAASDRPYHTVWQNLSREGFLALLSSRGHVLCGWGQTAFEAYYLGCHVIPVASRPEHKEEAKRLGVVAYDLDLILDHLKHGELPTRRRVSLDLQGAERTAQWIEGMV